MMMTTVRKRTKTQDRMLVNLRASRERKKQRVETRATAHGIQNSRLVVMEEEFSPRMN